MVALFLQEALVAEFEKMFSDFPLKSPLGGLVQLNIFSQNLPIPEAVVPPEGDVDPSIVEEGLAASDVYTDPNPYPFIIVRLMQGDVTEIGGEQTVEVYILIGTYDDDFNNHGYQDILNVIDKIYERFAKNPILGHRYECLTDTFHWELQEEESYPYFIGGIDVDFLIHPIEREDPFA